MSDILIFSDIHIHSHKKRTERLQDCIDALEWIFSLAKEKNIKNVVFAGDLFHDRQRIDVLTYCKTFEIFQKYKGLNIYLLLGNHDLWYFQKWDISSVTPLSAIDGVRVIDKPCTLKIDDHEISFLPYTHNPIEDLEKIKNNSKYKILFGHVAIDGAVWNVMHGTQAEVSVEHDGDMHKITSDIFSEWDQVFLGHYHAAQKLTPKVEYIGSPLQLSFGEAFQHKHVIIFNLETKEKQYVRNTFSPQHFIIPEKDVSKYDLNKNFIQILVEDISNSSIIDLRTNILSENTVGSLEIKPVLKKNEENVVLDAKAILHHESEMVEKYVEELEKANGLEDLNKDKLLEIGKGIFNNV